jgi:hypothetical protein
MILYTVFQFTQRAIENYSTCHAWHACRWLPTPCLYYNLATVKMEGSAHSSGGPNRLRTRSIIFWDVTPYSPLGFNRRFGGTYRFHLQGRRNRFSEAASKPLSWQ